MIMTLFAASEIPNPFPQSTPAQISSSNLSCFTAWQILHSQLNNYIFIYTVILYCMSLFYCGYYGRICPTVGKCVHNNLDLRRDAVIIYRLKIGHSRLTHSYLLSGDDHPTCTKCDAVLTVKHTLLDCPELRDVRLKYFTASSLKDIFEIVDNRFIIDFIKDAHFYHQL